MQIIKNKPKQNFLLAALIFGVVMAVYLFTLAPTIGMEDSAELVTAAYTLGIPHPSGFPLYCLLGKLFTFIPLGTIAWRLNLMSAVFGALTISLLFLVINKVVKSKLISFCSALILAFSSVFWSQSVVAEVYTLNSFFTVLLILILLGWTENKKNKYLLWFAFIFGLSLTNHTMGTLLAPVFALYILVTDKKVIREWKLILKMFFLFLLGLMVYLYLPLRAWQQAVFNWGPITNWWQVLAHISRAQYNDFAPFTNNFGKAGIAISFLMEIYQQFFLPTLFLAFGGAIYLWLKNKNIFLLTVGIFLFNSLGVIYLRKFGWSMGIDYTYRVYYIPAFLMVIVWLAVIMAYLYDFLTKIFKNKSIVIFRVIQTLLFLVIFSLPVSFLIANRQKCDLSDFWFNYDYTKNALASLEPNSMYFFAYDGSLQGDTELFSLIYLKMVENFRPDVDIITELNFFYKTVVLQVPKEYFKLTFEERRNKIIFLLSGVEDRPLYANFAITKENNDQGLFSLSNGYVYKVYPNFEEAKKIKPALYLASLRNLDQVDELSDYPNQGLAAHYYYNLAHFYLTAGEKNKSQYYLIKAFNLDTAPFNHEYRRFIDYRNDWLGKN